MAFFLIFYFVFLLFIPMYFCGKYAYSIFEKRTWNPIAGVVIGAMLAFIFSFLGLLILWLIAWATPIPPLNANSQKVSVNNKYPHAGLNVAMLVFVLCGSFLILPGICSISLSAIALPGLPSPWQWRSFYALLLGTSTVIVGIYIHRKSRMALNAGYIIATLYGIFIFMPIDFKTDILHNVLMEIPAIISLLIFAFGIVMGNASLSQLEKEDLNLPSTMDH